MSRIIRNSIFNGMAMTVTSILSLLLVPILVRTYGLETYGLISLIRLLTPLGAIGLMALGLPSLATRTAAMPGTKEERCAAQSTLLAVSMILGAILAISIFVIGWKNLAAWLNVHASGQAAFAIGFYVLIGALPILFAGALLTNALTGLGRFRALRVTEVTVFALYFVVSIVAAKTHAPIEVILIGLLVSDCLRAIALGIYAHRIALIRLSALLRPDWHWFGAHAAALRVLSVNVVSGYTRKYAPALTITLLYGPSALGLYDAVERIPRAFKTLLGLVNTAVLPRALALDLSANKNQLRSLLVRGNRLMLFFMLPVNVCVMFYSTPLLSIWLGANLHYAGALLILLMVHNTLETMLSIFTTASLSRIPLMQRQNIVNVIETICIVVLTVLLGSILGQTAVFWSTAFAAMVSYLLRIGPFLTSYHISPEQWYSAAGKALIGSLIGNGVIYLITYWFFSNEIFLLLTAPPSAIFAATLILLLWTRSERKDLTVIFNSLRTLVSR